MTTTRNISLQLLPHALTLHAESGDNLLETLVDNGIMLRTDCGGKGVCGKCSVEIRVNQKKKAVESCLCTIEHDLTIHIPETSLMSAHVLSKAPVILPKRFVESRRGQQSGLPKLGVAIDLGTTTIALYLCDMDAGEVLSSISVKNPQALYGDDVMSRIGKIGNNEEMLKKLQLLITSGIEWGVNSLLENYIKAKAIEKTQITTPNTLVVVGNPAMIHILLGISPWSIGIAPYQPQFYNQQCVTANDIKLPFPDTTIHTLPQISGFLGGDILAAALGSELSAEPAGTLLVDLGTNGELLLKGHDGYFGTSCATGPAFEGASLSCGIQAISGAIDKVTLEDSNCLPDYSVITRNGSTTSLPSGLCGSGILSAVAALRKTGVLHKSGQFNIDSGSPCLKNSSSNGNRFVLTEENTESGQSEISINQKDIRAVQLGKGALITGIEFLLKEAGIEKPVKIIVAGAFGSHIEKSDLLALGMIPEIDQENIVMAGNAAGAGAIVSLCDSRYRENAAQLAEKITVVDLALNIDFQKRFVENLEL